MLHPIQSPSEKRASGQIFSFMDEYAFYPAKEEPQPQSEVAIDRSPSLLDKLLSRV
jgi:hypothetical protein